MVLTPCYFKHPEHGPELSAMARIGLSNTQAFLVVLYLDCFRVCDRKGGVPSFLSPAVQKAHRR